MFRIIIVLMMFPVIYLFAGNEWGMTYDMEGIPQGLEIVDSLNFYSVTTSGVINKLYKSLDQGKSWEMIFDQFTGADFSNGMSAPNLLNLYAIFEKEILYRSTDGGKNVDLLKLDSVKSFKSITMYDTNIGVLTNTYIIPNIYYVLITHDGWKSYDKFFIEKSKISAFYRKPTFLNDSMVCTIVYDSKGSPFDTYLLKLNIKSKEYELNFIDKLYSGIFDLCVVNKELLFACGTSNTNNGGSCNDAIYKSTDGGKTWRRVLNLSTTNNKLPGTVPFGLQSIAFRDSLTGIAVGQFGKVVYTYDGGESWIYEDKLPESIVQSQPPTMIVRYAGSMPIIATYVGYIYRLEQDNLAPGPDNQYSISGRVWEGDHGQPGIPIANGYQVTMTDSAGYYHFRNLAKGTYRVKALNKYYDGVNPDFYYKPFAYHPGDYVIDLSSDTTGFDFNAEDLRVFRSVSGRVKNANDSGLADITVQIGDSVKTTDISGNYFFPKIESKRSFFITPIDSEYQFTPKYYSINIVNDTTELNFIASPITDVKETFENDLLNLYVTNGKLIVENQIPISGMTVIISDLLGMEVLKQPLRNEIDISSFSRGIYFVSILKSNNIYRTYKIYVE